MDQPMPDLMFRGMAMFFQLRDAVSPRATVLDEVDLKPGYIVLDYGCGPGGYVLETARRVGPTGKVYALDIHPLAVQKVEQIAARNKLHNVETICSNCDTGLPDGSVDVVLLYDIFHMLGDQQGVLAELHRVLKPGGTLSAIGEHMTEGELIDGITQGRLFRLAGKGSKTHRFVAA